MKKDKYTQGREDFAKEVLDMLDEVVRGTPNLQDFIYPIKESIRELRDKRKSKERAG